MSLNEIWCGFVLKNIFVEHDVLFQRTRFFESASPTFHILLGPTTLESSKWCIRDVPNGHAFFFDRSKNVGY